MINSPLPYAPKFSAFICHEMRRDPETDVRLFKFELTDDASRYPLGRVVCPESGLPGKEHSLVEFASRLLPQMAKLDKDDRLELMRKLIRQDSQNWQIGKSHPGDAKDECFADRRERLLQESTANIIRNPNGSLSMIMDYDVDLRGDNLTQILQQKGIFPSQAQNRLNLNA